MKAIEWGLAHGQKPWLFYHHQQPLSECRAASSTHTATASGLVHRRECFFLPCQLCTLWFAAVPMARHYVNVTFPRHSPLGSSPSRACVRALLLSVHGGSQGLSLTHSAWPSMWRWKWPLTFHSTLSLEGADAAELSPQTPRASGSHLARATQTHEMREEAARRRACLCGCFPLDSPGSTGPFHRSPGEGLAGSVGAKGGMQGTISLAWVQK